MQSDNFSGSEAVFISNKLEALKALTMLLIREINSLEELELNLMNKFEKNLSFNLTLELERIEERMIRCALIRSLGRQNKAAALLGMKLTTLNMKIKRYKINLSEPDDQHLKLPNSSFGSRQSDSLP